MLFLYNFKESYFPQHEFSMIKFKNILKENLNQIKILDFTKIISMQIKFIY